MSESVKFWRVVRWADKYEVSQSRSIDKLSWVPVPINLNSNGYLEMMEKDNGIALFGCWMAIIQVVASCDLRGSWVKSNYQPHNIRSLSIATRVDRELVEEVINLTLQVGWIEEVEMPLSELVSSIESIRDYRKLTKEERKHYKKPHPMEVWNNKFKPNIDNSHPSDRQVCPKERRGEEKREKERKEESVVVPKNPTEILEHLKNKFPKGTHTLSFCEDFYNKWTALDWTDSNKVPISWKHKVIFALNDYQEKKPKVVVSKKDEFVPLETDYYKSPVHTDEELEAFDDKKKNMKLPWEVKSEEPSPT